MKACESENGSMKFPLPIDTIIPHILYQSGALGISRRSRHESRHMASADILLLAVLFCARAINLHLEGLSLRTSMTCSTEEGREDHLSFCV